MNTEETDVSYLGKQPWPNENYNPKNPSVANECAQKIYWRFGCTQDGIGESSFINHATPIIEEYFKRYNANSDATLKAAIASWDEERQRALREAARVVTANRLLDRAFGHVTNTPLAGEISDYLVSTGAIKYL